MIFFSFLQVTSGTLIHITLISSCVENASLSILPKETTLASASKSKNLLHIQDKIVKLETFSSIQVLSIHIWLIIHIMKLENIFYF